MTLQGWLLILVFTALVVAITKPFGMGLFAIMEGRRTWLHPVLGPVERGFYKLSGIDPEGDQSWHRFGIHMLLFNAAGMFLTYAILRLQFFLPLNPLGFAGLPRTSPGTPRSASPPTPTGRAIAANRRCRSSARWSG